VFDFSSTDDVGAGLQQVVLPEAGPSPARWLLRQFAAGSYAPLVAGDGPLGTARRKATLVASLSMMASPPSPSAACHYDSIGLTAPVLLVDAGLLQGSRWAGSGAARDVIFEHAPLARARFAPGQFAHGWNPAVHTTILILSESLTNRRSSTGWRIRS